MSFALLLLNVLCNWYAIPLNPTTRSSSRNVYSRYLNGLAKRLWIWHPKDLRNESTSTSRRTCLSQQVGHQLKPVFHASWSKSCLVARHQTCPAPFCLEVLNALVAKWSTEVSQSSCAGMAANNPCNHRFSVFCRGRYCFMGYAFQNETTNEYFLQKKMGCVCVYVYACRYVVCIYIYTYIY